ncbi:uncharacterized protein MELLADRAFT_114040 [Melampsora larici-populina 98AG31]|uniref:Uncharacterized protein n=1 Tax=Melampsora larici-populina (strain 98AG31 / pathotype 3-4-7) TaxID=747676 RepID=F4SBY5_MELLP|nr:uncharacterized protein MELLADRAFT_114040 [Melampsora larici-populina 98AG31]EGF97843.1 hypothetical protein MELLADRAFT_114040 [Melampsora larici-populina 98AG31]
MFDVPTPVTPVPSVSTMTSTPEKNSTTESSDTRPTSLEVQRTKLYPKRNHQIQNLVKPSTSTNSDTDTDTDKEDSSTTNSTLSDTSDDTTIKDKSNPTHFKKNGTEKYDGTSSASQSLVSITMILSSF